MGARDFDIGRACAIEFFGDIAGTKLLARIFFAEPGFTAAGDGRLSARALKGVGLSDGEVLAFRILDERGGTLDEGPVDRLTMNDRYISKGAHL